MDNTQKWEKDFIEGVDLSKIEWKKFNANELRDFFYENYYDKDLCEYARANKDNSLHSPLGLKYLYFDVLDNLSYILGIVDNTMGKKTIVAATTLHEQYIDFGDYIAPFTLIYTVEVNSYFWRQGIYRKMCEALIQFLNPDQDIIGSAESEMGKMCNLFIMKDILEQNGFKRKIWGEEDLIHFETSGMYEIVRKRALKKSQL